MKKESVGSAERRKSGTGDGGSGGGQIEEWCVVIWTISEILSCSVTVTNQHFIIILRLLKFPSPSIINLCHFNLIILNIRMIQ